MGSLSDKSTWRIDYKSAATSDQRAAAVALVAAFDLNATPVPDSVSPLQARRALRAAGLLAAVNSAIAGADDDTKDAWQFATEIRRDNAIIAALAAQLNLTGAQVDALFIAAASL